MEYLIKLKHYLEIFFYPFFNYIGIEYKPINIIIKILIVLIWLLLISSICTLINHLNKRKREVNKENEHTSKTINIGLWSCLFTTFFYVILNMIFCYIYYHLDINKFIGFSIFSIGLFIIFIFYCIYMNKYYNPITEYQEQIEGITEGETTKSIIIYNEEKNKGTINFFICFLTFLILFIVLQLLLIILLSKNFKKDWFIGLLTNIFASNITIEETSSGVNYIRRNGCKIIKID